MAEMIDRPGAEIERVALVIGRGGGSGGSTGSDYFEDLPEVLDALRANRNRVRVLFLDATDEVLVRRYEGTRRRHPLAARGVEESIADERRLLAPVRDRADLLIDTGELNTNQLRTRVLEAFGDEGGGVVHATSVVSFGYKHGLPLDVDVVFDCRFLPNPFWVEELRPFSGLDEPVRDYVLAQPETKDFLDKVDELLTGILPSFVREGKSYLTIALGCTGGRHRSVALAEALAAAARRHGHRCRSSTGTWTGEPGVRRRLDRRPAVVALGGGHGTAVTLRAARRYAGRLTAVVSVADDGGSSGRLRELLNVVALGDLRKCLVALAAEDSALARAFEHRFDEGELAGHALGNLILAGLVEATGDLVAGRAGGGRAPRGGGRRPAGHGRAGGAQGRVGERAGGRPGGRVAGRQHPTRCRSSRATPRPPPAGRRADTGGRPDRDRPGLALHQRAGRGRGGGHRRGPGPLAGPAGLRLQPAPAAARDGGLRRGRPRGRSEQA